MLGVSVLVATINGNYGDHILFTIPGPSIPSWLGGLRLGGPVSAEGLAAAAIRGVTIVCIFLAFGVFNGAVSPHRVLRTTPAALFHASLVLTVGLTLLPSSIEDLRRTANRTLRGARGGFRDLPALVVPAVHTARTVHATRRGDGSSRLRSIFRGRGGEAAGGGIRPLFIFAPALVLHRCLEGGRMLSRWPRQPVSGSGSGRPANHKRPTRSNTNRCPGSNGDGRDLHSSLPAGSFCALVAGRRSRTTPSPVFQFRGSRWLGLRSFWPPPGRPSSWSRSLKSSRARTVKASGARRPYDRYRRPRSVLQLSAFGTACTGCRDVSLKANSYCLSPGFWRWQVHPMRTFNGLCQFHAQYPGSIRVGGIDPVTTPARKWPFAACLSRAGSAGRGRNGTRRSRLRARAAGRTSPGDARASQFRARGSGRGSPSASKTANPLGWRAAARSGGGGPRARATPAHP